MNTRQGGRGPCCEGVAVHPFVRCSRGRAWVIALVALLMSGTASWAADASKYVAPFYPKAVQGVVGKAPNARPDECPAAVLLTKDSIDKVKAFYDKKIGMPLRQVPQPYGQRLYGLVLELGEPTEEGIPWSDLQIAALGPAVQSPADPAKRQEAYQKGTLGWNGAWVPIHQLAYMTAWTPDIADPFMNPFKPGDLDALAKKYNRSQTYFYVLDAATNRTRDAVLADQFEQRLGQRKQQTLMGNMSAQQNIAANMGKEGEKIAAQDAQDDPEFNRIMQRKPALQKKYVALTQKMQQQMMSGQMDEADKTAEESDRLLRSDPEMAKLMKRYDQRDKQREAVAAKATAQGNAAEQDIYKQFGRKTWDDAVQTLEQMIREGYSTYIRIECHLPGKVERNPAKIDQNVTGWGAPGFDRQIIQYKGAIELGIPVAGDSPEKVAAMQKANQPAGAKPASAAAAAPAAPAPAAPAAAPAPPPPPPPATAQPQPKPDAKEAAKKGFNMLKKLF